MQKRSHSKVNTKPRSIIPKKEFRVVVVPWGFWPSKMVTLHFKSRNSVSSAYIIHSWLHPSHLGGVAHWFWNIWIAWVIMSRQFNSTNWRSISGVTAWFSHLSKLDVALFSVTISMGEYLITLTLFWTNIFRRLLSFQFLDKFELLTHDIFSVLSLKLTSWQVKGL